MTVGAGAGRAELPQLQHSFFLHKLIQIDHKKKKVVHFTLQEQNLLNCWNWDKIENSRKLIHVEFGWIPVHPWAVWLKGEMSKAQSLYERQNQQHLSPIKLKNYIFFFYTFKGAEWVMQQEPKATIYSDKTPSFNLVYYNQRDARPTFFQCISL